MRTMDLWYAAPVRGRPAWTAVTAAAGASSRRASGEEGREAKAGGEGGREGAKAAEKTPQKAHTRDSLQALSKLGELVDGQYRIVSQPPIVVPVRDLPATLRHVGRASSSRRIHEQFRDYRATLQDDRRHLLERFEVDRHGPQGRRRRQRRHPGVHRAAAGPRRSRTRCSCRSRRPPRRCWRTTCPRAGTSNPGERVVQGQRMMQAASDIFLGWTKGVRGGPVLLLAAAARHEGLGGGRDDDAAALTFYAAHVRVDAGPGPRPIRRPGRASPSTSGRSDAFDQSITDFSERYADQNEQDYQAFVEAIRPADSKLRAVHRPVRPSALTGLRRRDAPSGAPASPLTTSMESDP